MVNDLKPSEKFVIAMLVGAEMIRDCDFERDAFIEDMAQLLEDFVDSRIRRAAETAFVTNRGELRYD